MGYLYTAIGGFLAGAVVSYLYAQKIINKVVAEFRAEVAKLKEAL
jgi:predicted acylesterase/phospholipase RssA